MASLTHLAASLPPCAHACIVPAVTNSSCLPTDLSCICHSEALRSIATACILSTCTIRDSLTATNATNTLCGVEPTLDYSYVPVLAVFITLTAVVVAMRLMARVLMALPLWWDDFANSGAMLLCLAYTVYAIKIKDGGSGIDLWAVPLDNISDLLAGYYVLPVLYTIARLLNRVSIILFYIRVFRTSQSEPLLWKTLYGSIVMSMPLVLVAIFECTPVSFYWLGWDGESSGHCIDRKSFLWAVWVILLLYDFWILGVPMPSVAKLQLSLRKKVLVAIMFSTGLAVVAISIYKLTLIDLFTRNVNPTVDTVRFGIWAGVEIHLGVICACMPSIPVLVRPVLQRLKSTQLSTGTLWGNSGYASRYGKNGTSARRAQNPQASVLHRSENDSSHDNNSGIRMVTTIQQTEGAVESGLLIPAYTATPMAVESELQIPAYTAAPIEMSNMDRSNLRVQAWA